VMAWMVRKVCFLALSWMINTIIFFLRERVNEENYSGLKRLECTVFLGKTFTRKTLLNRKL
jgi:hypothetical protein